MCLTDVFEFAIYNNRSLLIHNYTVCVQIVQLFVKYFAQSLVFCVVFCKSWIVRLSFSFWPLYCMFLFRFSALLAIVLHVLVSIHGFWSPLWYFQIFFLTHYQFDSYVFSGGYLGYWCLTQMSNYAAISWR